MSYTQSLGKLLVPFDFPPGFFRFLVKQFSHFPETSAQKFYTISPFSKYSEFSVELKNARRFLLSCGAVERSEHNSRNESYVQFV